MGQFCQQNIRSHLSILWFGGTSGEALSPRSRFFRRSLYEFPEQLADAVFQDVILKTGCTMFFTVVVTFRALRWQAIFAIASSLPTYFSGLNKPIPLIATIRIAIAPKIGCAMTLLAQDTVLAYTSVLQATLVL